MSLSLYLFICLSIYLPTYLSIYLSICIYLSVSIYLSILSNLIYLIYLSIGRSIDRSIDRSIGLSIYGNVLHATTACTFSTSQLPKVVRMWCAFTCFSDFDFEMSCAPQERALFGHLKFQKWSKRGV